MLKRVISTFIACAMVVGCASHNLQTYGTIDSENMTITVPAGGKGLKGALKKNLSINGWSLFVDRGPEITKGSFGSETNLKKYNTFNGRYRLYVAWNQYDYCLDFQPMISYDISIVDNEGGAEVLTLDGRGCEDTVVKKFDNALKELAL